MVGGYTQFHYGIFVTLSGVARVFRPAIAGELPVQIGHDPVARDLGDDAGGGNGQHLAIALDDRLCRAGQIGGQAVAVDQQMVWGMWQGGDGAAHGKVCGVEDVQRVDLGRAGMADADLCRSHDRVMQPRAGLRAQAFGIAQTLGDRIGAKPHGGGCHRPGQRAAPDFIDAHDPAGPGAGKLGFKHEIGGLWHKASMPLRAAQGQGPDRRGRACIGQRKPCWRMQWLA